MTAHRIIDVVGAAELSWAPPDHAVFVAVGGSRRRGTDADREQVMFACAERLERPDGRPVVFVSGGCPQGADRHVELFVEAAGLTLVRFLPALAPEGAPHWLRTGLLHARNTRVVMLGHELLAQVADDRTGGTEDAVKKAHRLGRPVTLLRSNGACVLEHPPVSKRRRGVVSSTKKQEAQR